MEKKEYLSPCLILYDVDDVLSASDGIEPGNGFETDPF